MPPVLKPAAHPLERLPDEWTTTLVSWGEPSFRGLSVFRWIHQRGITDPHQMTDLPKRVRERLQAEGLGLPAMVGRSQRDVDHTRKLLVRFNDDKQVESVLIPQSTGGLAQCISTQVGCAMGCGFCASGMAGLKRNLSAAEILAQLHLGRNVLEPNERVRNVVLMGMGEPLHNYDAVARALTVMSHPEGLGFSTRRVTLSTSGLVPEIDRLGKDFAGQIQLAVSLHSVDDHKRSELMPINRKYPISELLAALRRYPLPKRRRITIEYTLIRGENDGLKDADRLAKLLRGIPVKVNLIPMNPVADSPYQPPEEPTVDAFQRRLLDHHLTVLRRKRRGGKIDAACGQLALHGEARRIRLRVQPRTV